MKVSENSMLRSFRLTLRMIASPDSTNTKKHRKKKISKSDRQEKKRRGKKAVSPLEIDGAKMLSKTALVIVVEIRVSVSRFSTFVKKKKKK